MKGFTERWMARAVVVLLACAPAVLTAENTTAMLRAPHFQAVPGRLAALPGRSVEVELRDRRPFPDRYEATGCRVWFENEIPVECPEEVGLPVKLEIPVPNSAGPASSRSLSFGSM